MVVLNDPMADNEADSALDEKVIKRTQETLGKLIKAPPLTEKLLTRPPFRFLHDVITAVMKSTGFMKGLHPDSDLKSDNVKEKDQKVAFLQKTLDFVVFVIGRPLSTNPLKVVAGKEADKTNEFLQAIAEAASKKVDNEVMVKRFAAGEKYDPSAVNSGNATPSKPQNKPAAPPSKPPGSQPQSKSKEKPKENGEKSRGQKDDAGKRGRDESPERPSDTTNLKNRPREAGRERGKPGDLNDSSDGEGPFPDQGPPSDQPSNRRLNRPPSARGRQPSGVPGARGTRGVETSEGSASSDHVGSAKPSKLATPSASDATAKSKIVIQKASKEGDSDEEDEFIVREAGPGAVPLGAPDGTAATLLGATEDQHGALVQKIIDTTKALDAKTGAKVTKMSPAEEAALRRHREAVTRDMERLCGAVQASARLAAPLARLSELVQEDLDAMNTELNMWRAEHRKAIAQIAQAANPASSRQGGLSQKSAITSPNDSLRGQLRELDGQLAEIADAVVAVRGNCMRNEQRIAHMLSGSSGASGSNADKR